MSLRAALARLPDGARMRERVVLLRGAICDQVASETIAKLLFLADESPRELVSLYIDSPGGQVSSALAICDAIDHVRTPVATHCLATASGVALALLAHGARGHRSACPAADLRHAPARAAGPDDIQQIERTNRTIAELIATDCKRGSDDVLAELLAERSFTAAEAIRAGVIDRIAQ